jgi:hypothetical protein
MPACAVAFVRPGSDPDAHRPLAGQCSPSARPKRDSRVLQANSCGLPATRICGNSDVRVASASYGQGATNKAGTASQSPRQAMSRSVLIPSTRAARCCLAQSTRISRGSPTRPLMTGRLAAKGAIERCEGCDRTVCYDRDPGTTVNSGARWKIPSTSQPSFHSSSTSVGSVAWSELGVTGRSSPWRFRCAV